MKAEIKRSIVSALMMVFVLWAVHFVDFFSRNFEDLIVFMVLWWAIDTGRALSKARQSDNEKKAEL